MPATENKKIITAVMAALAEGDRRPFGAAMADNFAWTIIGSTGWSKRYEGRETVLKELITPLFGNFVPPYKNRARTIIAEGDMVVVECKGEATTKSGKPYNNEYCYVIEMTDGKMIEFREYCDTALIERVLEAPRAAAS